MKNCGKLSSPYYFLTAEELIAVDEHPGYVAHEEDDHNADKD